MTSKAVFFISADGVLYGAGDNLRGQLGSDKEFKLVPEPIPIESIQNVLNVQSSEKYAIALCHDAIGNGPAVIDTIDE